MNRFFTSFRGKHFAAQAGYVSFGAIMQRLALWGIVVLLARLGSVGVVGQFALASAVVLPLSRFAALQLPQVVLAQNQKSNDFVVFQVTHLLSCSLMLFCLMVGCLVLGVNSDFSKLLAVLAIARTFEGFSELSYSFLQQVGQFRVVAILQIVRSLVTISVVTIVYAITGSLLSLVFGLAIVWGGFAFLVDVPVAFRHASNTASGSGALKVKWGAILTLVKPSLLLGFCSLITIGFGSLPRYVLNMRHGLASVGIFESLAALTLIVDLLSQAVARASAPRFSQAFEAHDSSQLLSLYSRLAGIYITIGLLGVVGGILLGPWVLGCVYLPEYAGYANVLVVLLCARAFSAASSYDSLLVTLSRRFSLTAVWAVSLAVLAGMLMMPLNDNGLMSISLAVLSASIVRCVLIHGTLFLSFRSGAVRPSRSQPMPPCAATKTAA